MQFVEQNLELFFFILLNQAIKIGPVFAFVIHQDGLKIRRFMLFTFKKWNRNGEKNMDSNESDVASYYKRKTKKKPRL